MKTLLFLFMAFYQSLAADDFKLRNGDLIFQKDCSGNTDNTIKEVTASVGDYRFTHVGIVYIDANDSVYVMEATPPRVKVTPLAEYLHPQKEEGCYPQSVVGRLKEQYRFCIPQAIEEGLALVEKDYDNAFVLNNDKYYCSELIYDILLKANEGKTIFPLNVMTFKSPDTDEITEGWAAYFEKLDMPVPEGELGINPGVMSRAEVIDIIYCYENVFQRDFYKE